jgi:hypothetical protein
MAENAPCFKQILARFAERFYLRVGAKQFGDIADISTLFLLFISK